MELRANLRYRGCFHPAGTASMGTVVDTELRVNGITGLRVADASVIPTSISANFQVVVYALAEQASDIIFDGIREGATS